MRDSVRILYFAALRDRTGRPEEFLAGPWPSLLALYQALDLRYGFGLEAGTVKAALNGTYADWSAPVGPGDEVAFLPPVSGG